MPCFLMAHTHTLASRSKTIYEITTLISLTGMNVSGGNPLTVLSHFPSPRDFKESENTVLEKAGCEVCIQE